MAEKTDLELAKKVAEAAADSGGRAYFVGGYVRDRLLGKPGKDLDLEIHGLTEKQLETLLESLGTQIEMGKSFCIRSLRGSGLDIALPMGEDGKTTEPFRGPEAAALRRDFTVNAMMEDVLTGEILDFFGGREDLNRGILRPVRQDAFQRDPLRVLRAARLGACLNFEISEETMALCRGTDLSQLPRERVFGELKKALLESEKPSRFFKSLREMDQLGFWFPELQDLIGVPQSPRHHREGDVWNHTMLVLDAAKAYTNRVPDPVILLLAAVTHDFGKAVCTEEIRGEIHAYNHETLGLPLAEAFLRRLTGDRKRIAGVLNLTALHMKPNVLAGCNASLKSSNRMFDQALDPETLICLGLADGQGKLPKDDGEKAEAWLCDRLKTYREYMARPCVTGKDLIDAGISPGKEFSSLLKFAHKLRLAGIPRDSALKQTLAMAGKKGK